MIVLTINFMRSIFKFNVDRLDDIPSMSPNNIKRK